MDYLFRYQDAQAGVVQAGVASRDMAHHFLASLNDRWSQTILINKEAYLAMSWDQLFTAFKAGQTIQN